MKSFAILRTNVGLTTNIKVMVDSKYSLSLESIDSIPDLSVKKLKKVGFNKNNYYDELVPYFFKGFPTETAFAIKYDNDSESMTDNFAHQYDEIYQYGARNIISNKDYDEEFEYFAPIHITKGKFPKNFIIFRVDGPGMIKLDRFNIKNEIFNNFKTVKLFDLTKNTNLGEWIDNNFIKNNYFPNTAVEINFENLEFSQWNGIDYTSGGYTTKSLFLDDFLGEEKEIFEMEKFILDGFKTNKVIYPNIINFSFLFDDTPANSNSLKKWSINRYYGFYLDNMDLISTMSPYKTPFLKNDITIEEGNILSSTPGDPFVEGWSDDRPYYVEYNGDYFKVEKFIEQVNNKSLNKIIDKSNTREKSVSSVTIGNTVIKEEITYTYVDKWRIISDLDLTGKQSLLNKNVGYIRESDKALLNYDNTDFEIADFEIADLWLMEIDGMYHNLIKEDGIIKIHSDYSFKFYENEYEYWINKPDPTYTKRVNFIVDDNNSPKKFKIYRLKLTDIKDFDDRIVDTEYSKFEYEMENDITDTEETKLYMTNLNSYSHPKELDDFKYKNKVVNIPVSSEYVANHELFKIYDNDELTALWRKNSVHCRWAFENSLSANDYPYLLNNSIRFEDYNRSVNPFNPDPIRMERNLDYFYTINSSTFSYLHHTLHVENNNENGLTRFDFDFEKYLGKDNYSILSTEYNYDFDYFSYFFNRKSTFLSNKIQKNVKKYSIFSTGDQVVPNLTLFRGIKFIIHDIDNIKVNSNKQIESINVKNSNSFDGYKFSILLTGYNNGMVWDVIDEWKMDKEYKEGSIVVYNDILYRAKRDVNTKHPVVYRNSLQVKALPYNLTNDWELYVNDNVPLYNPLKSKNKFYSIDDINFLKSIVYNSGDYYIFNGYDKAIDFWNPLITYDGNPRLSKYTNGKVTFSGYSTGSIVLYRGDYYKSLIDNNIYAPNYTQEIYDGGEWKKYWVKIEPVDSVMTRWSEINIWNPGSTYTPNTYIVHNDVLYISNNKASNISSGEEPGISDLWNRLYSFIPDTDFKYQPYSNPFIRMNNEYYQIISNPWSKTLENGINIYINKKFKNVLVNISINDNTILGLRDKNRDELYVALNKKLTTMSFIESINNLSNKRDFTDYINYIVISEDGTIKNYNYNNIEELPYILSAEKPEDVIIKANSLDINKVNVDIKSKKSLVDGEINNLSELNYFNNTHVATTIDANLNSPIIMKNYHGGENLITDTLYRFSGNYIPLFYDIELFKKDNTIEYNEMQIVLDLDKTQDLVFSFTKNDLSIEKIYTIYPGASYSYVSNTDFTITNSTVNRDLEYDILTGLPINSSVNDFKVSSEFVNRSFYDQIKNIILSEDIFYGVEFMFETHYINSQYVSDPIFNEYSIYDNNKRDLGEIRNFNLLSVKYKSSYGNLKLEITQVKPTITVDFVDFSTPGSNLEVKLGATGLNPPFQWSFGYTASIYYNTNLFSTQSYSTTDNYLLPDTSGTDLIFSVMVIDSIGLTSNAGVYTINSGSPTTFNGTFSYTTL